MLIWKQKHVFAGVIKNGMNGQPITILLSDEAAAFQAQQKIAYNIRRVQSGFGVFILRSNTTNKVVDGLFDIICYESKNIHIYQPSTCQPLYNFYMDKNKKTGFSFAISKTFHTFVMSYFSAKAEYPPNIFMLRHFLCPDMLI